MVCGRCGVRTGFFWVLHSNPSIAVSFYWYGIELISNLHRVIELVRIRIGSSHGCESCSSYINISLRLHLPSPTSNLTTTNSPNATKGAGLVAVDLIPLNTFLSKNIKVVSIQLRYLEE